MESEGSLSGSQQPTAVLCHASVYSFIVAYLATLSRSQTTYSIIKWLDGSD
jgi:hypothetical protein